VAMETVEPDLGHHVETQAPLFVASSATRQLRGIYGILCVVNGRLYIGGTGRSFIQRWAEHVRELTFPLYEIENAMRRDFQRTSASFVFFVVEVVEHREQVRERERFWRGYFANWGPALYNIHTDQPQ
jgi:hypothetical protein